MLNKKVEYTLTIDEKQIQVLIESLFVYMVTKDTRELDKESLMIAEELREEIIKGK